MESKSLEKKLPNEECGRYLKMLRFLTETRPCGSRRIKTFFLVVCACQLFWVTGEEFCSSTGSALSVSCKILIQNVLKS